MTCAIALIIYQYSYLVEERTVRGKLEQHAKLLTMESRGTPYLNHVVPAVAMPKKERSSG